MELTLLNRMDGGRSVIGGFTLIVSPIIGKPPSAFTNYRGRSNVNCLTFSILKMPHMKKEKYFLYSDFDCTFMVVSIKNQNQSCFCLLQKNAPLYFTSNTILFNRVKVATSVVDLAIDLIQHQKFQGKRYPFHGRFTHKTARVWSAKLMNI